MGSIPTAPGIAEKSEKTISFLAFSCFIHDNRMLAERAFCVHSIVAARLGLCFLAVSRGDFLWNRSIR